MNSQPLQAQKQAVPGEFDRVAGRYDLLTGMNPGYRKHLRWSAERMRLVDGPELELLVMCCGNVL